MDSSTSDVIVIGHEESDELTHEWPDNFPDGCPCEQSKVRDFPEDGLQVYRVTLEKKPDLVSFQTSFDKDSYPDKPLCKRLSLSSFSRKDKAILQAKKHPHLGNYICSGTLHRAHGKMSKPDSNKHFSWWRVKGLDGRELFSHECDVKRSI